MTGSQGKTSTKDLLAAVLAEAGPTVATYGSFNNELGMPLTALRVEPDTRFLVLEMGARGIGHLTELTDLVAPDVSVVLNVGTAHLGEFGSRDAIAQAKGELVAALRTDGVAVLNADDPRVAAMATLVARAGADLRDRGCRRTARGRRAGPSGPSDLHARDRRRQRRGGAPAGRRPPGHQRRGRGHGRARRRDGAGGRGGRAGRRRRRSRSGGWSCTSWPAAWCCSTTPTTPTPSRCGPVSTRWSARRGRVDPSHGGGAGRDAGAR